MISTHRHRSCLHAAALLISLAAAQCAAAGEHEHTDFAVGRDDAAPIPALHLEGDPDILDGIEKIPLLPGEGELADYFIAQLPGWESAEPGDPDLLPPLTGHRIALRRLSFSPGFTMFEPFGLGEILAADGATFEYPADPGGGFHIDLFFAAPIGDPIGTQYSATFQLTDLAGLHDDSDAFTLRFEVMPEPVSLLLAVFCLTAGRNRRMS